MPPSKKSKSAATASSSASATADATTLIARLGRADLEALVLEHIGNGARLTLESLKALLPEQARAAELPRAPPVARGEERTGTGRFDDISDECLLMIFRQLPLRSRLTFTITVCKAWRSLRAEPSLWMDLGPLHGTHGNPQHLLSTNTTVVPVNNDGLRRLISWVPSLANISHFDLDTSERIGPDVVKLCLKQLPNLTSLRLAGKKVTAAAIKALPPLPKLTDLTLGEGAYHGDESKEVLRKTPLLQKITLPPHGNLQMVANALQIARNGGTPLITDISITSSWGATSCAQLENLGKQYPELGRLSFKEVSFRLYVADLNWNVAQMSRLTELSILKFCTFSNHMSTHQFTNIFPTLLAACPALTHLTLHHGVHHITGKERKEGKVLDPFPRANGIFQHLPSTLRYLSLADIVLACGDIDCLITPDLSRVRMRNCGPDSPALAAELMSQSNKLDGTTCTVDMTRGSFFGF